MIGRKLDHYQILEKIGQGGVGVVYRAFDTLLDRQVAIKILSGDYAHDPAARKRMLREAKAASSIEHGNVVTVHGVGETREGEVYIVMALHEGVPLDEYIATGAASIEEAVRIVSEIALGLEALHRRGIIHRDIKPGNIILSDDGHARLIDFGLAKLLGASKITKTGTTVGTLEYMAPEQAAGYATDARVDVYALGVVLYELLTGVRPHQGEHKSVIVYSIVNQDPKPLRDISPHVPQSIADVVARAMAKNPGDRIQSPGELRDELRIAMRRRPR